MEPGPGPYWDIGFLLCPDRGPQNVCFLTRKVDKNSRIRPSESLRTIREFWTMVPAGIWECGGVSWEQELISQGPLQVVSNDCQIVGKAKGSC